MACYRQSTARSILRSGGSSGLHFGNLVVGAATSPLHSFCRCVLSRWAAQRDWGLPSGTMQMVSFILVSFQCRSKVLLADAMLHRLVWDFPSFMSTYCRLAGRACPEWTACHAAVIESGAAAVVARRLVIQGPSSRRRGGLRSSRRSCCR